MKRVYIVDARRTPIGKYRGSLRQWRSDDLAAELISTMLGQSKLREEVAEVIFGATNQAGEDNRNVARMASLLANLAYEVTGVTVNRLCGSGMEAIVQGFRAIRQGAYDVGVSGGVESMTRAPFVFGRPEEDYPRKSPAIFDTKLGWRFPNPRMQERFELISMGETAEVVAERYAISREDQDQFAYDSHQKAASATDQKLFDDELIVLPNIEKKGASGPLMYDEGIRRNTTLSQLSALRPVFQENGTVTAGNASPLSDGAAGVVLASEEAVNRLSLVPIARIVESEVAGVHPEVMGIGPVSSTHKLLERTQTHVSEIDLVELNEAFASQSLACVRELGIDPGLVNVQGGALALGHPIGCSGCRIVVTLAHAMKRRSAKLGLATCCIGVGQGMSLLLARD